MFTQESKSLDRNLVIVDSNSQIIESWAEYNTYRVRSQQKLGIEFAECIFGGKTDNGNYWTELFWSNFTGWSQVLYFSSSPQSDTAIVNIRYYDSALAAILDFSIFPLCASDCASDRHPQATFVYS